MSLHWQHGNILLTKRAQSKLPISFDLKLLSSIQWLQNFQTSIVTENVLILWEIEKEKKKVIFRTVLQQVRAWLTFEPISLTKFLKRLWWAEMLTHFCDCNSMNVFLLYTPMAIYSLLSESSLGAVHEDF